MKAWLLPSFAGTDSLQLSEMEAPTPGPDEVQLDLQFAALNPADYYLAQGQYPAQPPFPHILGRDGVGIVRAVGSNVRGTRVGDVRAILRGEAGVSRWGTLATQVVVPEGVLVPIPAGWSPEQAAAGPLVYLTAYQAISQWNNQGRDQGRDLPEKAVVLITGASGGVGLAAIHLAQAMGYVPVGLSRDENKWPALRDYGARLVLSPTDPKWRETLYGQLGRRPVNLVIDNVAGPGFSDVFDTLAQNGRVSVIGALAGPVPQFNTASLFFRRIQIGGTAVGTYTAPEAQQAWQAIVALLARTGRKPVIDSVHPFENVPAAFARLKQGVLGKVLVRIA